MDNDKSTALVSVQDLSAVLQGVKRYIDSSKPNVSWDELASSKTAYIPVELTWNEAEKLYIGNIWHNTSKVRVNGVEYDCPSFDFMGRPGYGNGNIAAWESNGFPFSYANFADGQVLVACKGNDSFLPINTFEFIVEQSSLCPQDYVESSLGNNTLRDDIKALSEKKPDVSWDDLYGGERIIHCDTFEKRTGGVSGVVSVIPLSTPVVMDADGNITPDLPSKFYIKNLHFERGTYHENGSEDLSADFLNSCNRYGDGVIELSGYGEYVAELDNNLRLLIGMMPSGVVEFEDGSFQLNSLAFMIDAMDYNETERLCTFDFIEKSEASPCPPSYVASSIGNESLEEDIKFLKENSGKVTIDGLVKQEFGEVVSTEYYGMTMQGILTNIPAQEGVSFKLSNIHYEDDIHFYDTSLSEGTPEAVYAKDDANRVMHYPTELSGVLEYHQGALGYSEEFDSTGLHALVDFGLGYMVYVDNFGFELSLKPLISYPLKLEVSSLISPDYVESSIGNSSLREDIEFLKENSGKVTWDTLGKSASVLCDEQAVVDGEVSSNTKIPFDAPFDPSNPPTIRLANLQALRDYYNSDNNVVYTKDEFNQAIKENGWDDMTFSYFPEQFYEYYILAEPGFQFGILVKQGDDFGALINFDNEEDSTHAELLFSCEIVKDAEKCNPDYIGSSLGKANLREDLEKGITWDLIYGIKHNLVTCDELVQLKSGDYWYYGTKVPFDAPFDLSNQPMLKLQNVRAKGIVFGVPEEQLNQMLINFSWNVQSWVNWEEGGVITSLFGSELDSEICIVTQEGLDYGILWWGLHSAEDYTGENAGKLVFDIDSVSQNTHLEHCTGYRSDAGTVIPLSEPFSIGNAPTIRLKDITFLHDYYSDNHRLIYTREQLVQLLGNNKDFVCSVWETGSNLVDGAYMCDIPAEDGSVFMRVLAMTGLPQAYIQMAGDAFVGGRLIDCYVEVGEGYKLCPSEYIASPLGSASLKADVEMLQRKLDKVLQALQYATFTQDVSGILGDL